MPLHGSDHGPAQSQVSRMIAELEASLGARLLTRTTRAVVPTEARLEFLGRMEPILATIDRGLAFVGFIAAELRKAPFDFVAGT